MHRALSCSLTMLALTAATALADPGVNVLYFDGIMRVALEGSYAGSVYTVWRSGELAGEYVPTVNFENVLCTGDCFVHDLEAVPGRTYYYRFELFLPNGGFVVYGPYAVTVPDTPFAARLWPNPGSGATRVVLSLPGGRRDAPLESDARILDLEGRTVRVLHHGPLARGSAELAWDGRGADGYVLRPGLYFLRFTSPLGTTTARVVRIR